MKIFIMGIGHMGAWLTEELHHDHEVAIFDQDPRKLKYFFQVKRLQKLSEVEFFEPQLMINTVSLRHTREAFDAVLPYLNKGCVLSDIASIKTGLHDYYMKSGFRFVSTHPMFGPTFSNIRDLRDSHAILIKESDPEGLAFFRNLYKGLRLQLHTFTFEQHDVTAAYSLSIPFASTVVFAACMKKQEAPGSTFKKHLEIAKGLLAEDGHLLTEILFNPHTTRQLEKIHSQLAYLTHIIKNRDYEVMEKYLDQLRNNIA